MDSGIYQWKMRILSVVTKKLFDLSRTSTAATAGFFFMDPVHQTSWAF
jgi:hypothetical protein